MQNLKEQAQFDLATETGVLRAAIFLPLYAGPILAGLAGGAMPIALLFGALFTITNFASRKPSLRTDADWAIAVVIAVTQFAFAAASMGFGKFLSDWVGLSSIPVWAAVFLSAMATTGALWTSADKVTLGQLMAEGVERVQMIDRALKIDFASADGVPSPQDTLQIAVRLIQGLPRDMTAMELDPIANRLAQSAGTAIFEPFYALINQVDGPSDPRLDLLFLRYCAVPEVKRHLTTVRNGAIPAMALLDDGHRRVRAEARARVIDHMKSGAPVHQLPDPVWLRDLAELFPREGYDKLAKEREMLSKV